MLFRVLAFASSVLFALGIVFQVIWPALRDRRLFPSFRKHSRLRRAERLRVEALQRRDAARHEAEALRVEFEIDAIDSEVLQDLTTTEEKPRSR